MSYLKRELNHALLVYWNMSVPEVMQLKRENSQFLEQVINHVIEECVSHECKMFMRVSTMCVYIKGTENDLQELWDYVQQEV